MRYLLPLLVCMSFLILSCGSPESGDSGIRKTKSTTGMTLALMVKRADIPWYRMQIRGFEEICKEQGAKYLILDNRMDTNLTLTNIDTLINRKVDGVALAITEQKMSGIVVNRIFEAGIPIVSLNYKLIDNQGRQLAPHIGIDYSAAGREAGNWLLQKAEDQALFSNSGITPGIAELNAESVMEINEWINMVKETLSERNKGISPKMFYRVASPVNDAAGAMIAMQELLSAHPTITNWIVYAGSSDEMNGAITALEQVGMSKYVIAFSIEAGGVSETETFQSSSLKASLMVDTYNQGKEAARLLINNIRSGIPIPPITLSSYTLMP